MGKQRIILGSLPRIWRFFFLGLILFVLFASFGALVVHVSPGLALSVFLLVLVWGGIFSYIFSNSNR
jgi:ABC-type multidrug transport system permease subunit